jgi:hypothetical protein
MINLAAGTYFLRGQPREGSELRVATALINIGMRPRHPADQLGEAHASGGASACELT